MLINFSLSLSVLVLFAFPVSLNSRKINSNVDSVLVCNISTDVVHNYVKYGILNCLTWCVHVELSCRYFKPANS